jgi:hypothetical protein
MEELKTLVAMPFDIDAFRASAAEQPKKPKGPKCRIPEHVRWKRQCGTCFEINRAEHRKTARRFLYRCIHNARSKRRLDKATCTLTLDILIDIVIEQRGLCAISKVPLVFLLDASNWRASLERINPSLPYTRDNVCFIAWEFQSMCNRGRGAGAGESSQWTREKFLELSASWNQSNVSV